MLQSSQVKFQVYLLKQKYFTKTSPAGSDANLGGEEYINLH